MICVAKVPRGAVHHLGAASSLCKCGIDLLHGELHIGRAGDGDLRKGGMRGGRQQKDGKNERFFDRKGFHAANSFIGKIRLG